ncbi:MAG: type II secretion system protein [Candidatus Paceibacterota bacterium]|jgi:type II secretory pathway pseudopilin PulG
MNKFLRQKNKAFTLVETLVSISIFTMSILGLMSILASSISNTNYVKQKITAEYLAQEGIEHARNIRDTHVLYDISLGWDNFKSDDSVTDYDSPSGYSNFNREVFLTPISSDEVKITSTVMWNQGSGQKSVTLSANLFNWIE